MDQYFAMGGYADYVWPAYLITLVVVVGLIVVTRIDLARQRKLLASLEKDGSRKRAPARSSGEVQ